MEKRTNVVTFGGNPVTLLGNEIKVGDKAPDFSAITISLQPVSLRDFDGKAKLISVYPSIDTGICSAQTRRFNEEAAKLDGLQVISISCDLPFALGRFCATEGIDKALTVSDHYALDFGLKYGFAIEQLRLLARGVVILDKENTVRYVEYVKEITTHPDYDLAISVAKSLI